MTTWSRNGDANFSEFKHRVKLTSHQWSTINQNGEKPGYDLGGPLHLVRGIFDSIKSNESFNAFTLERRATKTMFFPEILVKDEPLPEHLTTAQAVQGLSMGPQYDIFISFATKEEMTLFKLSFSGNVNVGFDGVN